jgi:hypothetical protein
MMMRRIVYTMLVAFLGVLTLGVPAYAVQGDGSTVSTGVVDARDTVSGVYTGESTGYMGGAPIWSNQEQGTYSIAALPKGMDLPACGMGAVYNGFLKDFRGWHSTVLLHVPRDSDATSSQCYLAGFTRRRMPTSAAVDGDYIMSRGYDSFGQTLVSSSIGGMLAASPAHQMFSVLYPPSHEATQSNGWGSNLTGYGYGGCASVGVSDSSFVVEHNSFKDENFPPVFGDERSRWDDRDVLGFQHEDVLFEFMDAIYPEYWVAGVVGAPKTGNPNDGTYAGTWHHRIVFVYGRNDMGGLPIFAEFATVVKDETLASVADTIAPPGLDSYLVTWNDSGAVPILVHAPTDVGGGISPSHTYMDWYHLYGDPSGVAGFGYLSPLSVNMQENIGGGAGIWHGIDAWYIVQRNSDASGTSSFQVGGSGQDTTASVLPANPQVPDISTPGTSSLVGTYTVDNPGSPLPGWLIPANVWNLMWSYVQDNLVSKAMAATTSVRGLFGFVSSVSDTSTISP